MLLSRSSARLRTKTGCHECRISRKKCDEQHPTCSRCLRIAIVCNWPDNNQLIDRRSRKSLPGASYERRGSDCLDRALLESNEGAMYDKSSDSNFPVNGSVDTDSDIALLQPQQLSISEPPLFFTSGQQYSIFNYFAETLLPNLVHYDADPEYHDHSYMLSMGLESPILMNTMIACAAMQLSISSELYRAVALRSYVSAVSGLRSDITSGTLSGTEDNFLATTSLLCIFENCRTDALPKIGPHLNALGSLLKLRSSLPTNRTAAMSSFEQTMAESFLYHGVLLMLFDHCFDPFIQLPTGLFFERYFPKEFSDNQTMSANSYSSHPVLGTSYRLFLNISDVTRMARLPSPLSTGEALRWERLSFYLQDWEYLCGPQSTSYNPGTYMYIDAARALLTKSMLAEPVVIDDCLGLCLRRGLKTLKSVSIDTAFSSYYLWPLVVLGSMATGLDDRAFFEALLENMASKRKSGLISWVLLRLQTIWDRVDTLSLHVSSPKYEGLSMLVERDSLD